MKTAKTAAIEVEIRVNADPHLQNAAERAQDHKANRSLLLILPAIIIVALGFGLTGNSSNAASDTASAGIENTSPAANVEDLDHDTARLEWILAHPGTNEIARHRAHDRARVMIEEVSGGISQAYRAGDDDGKKALLDLRRRLTSVLTISTDQLALN